jgi:hypothetical protein
MKTQIGFCFEKPLAIHKSKSKEKIYFILYIEKSSSKEEASRPFLKIPPRFTKPCV